MRLVVWVMVRASAWVDCIRGEVGRQHPRHLRTLRHYGAADNSAGSSSVGKCPRLLPRSDKIQEWKKKPIPCCNFLFALLHDTPICPSMVTACAKRWVGRGIGPPKKERPRLDHKWRGIWSGCQINLWQFAELLWIQFSTHNPSKFHAN